MPGEGVDPRFDERMTDLEALMWGLEKADPSLQTVMVMAGVLERPVDPAVMLERLQETCAAVPRLSEFPEHGPLPMVPPRWVIDPEFDVANHLRSRTATGAGFDALAELVGCSLSEPLDEARPPWDFTLVDGLDGGRGGFVARLHHSYTDGQGAVQIAMGLFDPPDDGSSAISRAASRRPSTQGGPVPDPAEGPVVEIEGLVSDVVHELGAGVAAVRRLIPWAAEALRQAFEDPAGATERAVEFTSSLARTARSAMMPGSPLLACRSGETHVSAVLLSLDDLRAAGKNCGGTVNDVFLAGALGGLQRYHERMGMPFPAVKLGIPVSTRGDSDNLHNQLQGMLVRAPLDLPDPKERIRLIHAIVAETRTQPWLPLVDVAAAAAVRLPLAPNALAGMVRLTEVLASNLPGPPERLRLAGAGVDVLVPFGPRAGSALNLTLLSYAGGVAVGVNADAAAVSDLDLFVECLRSAFDEVLA